MTLIDDKKDPAQGLDIESTQDMKLSDYDFKIEAAADKETDRQAHLGVDVERTPEDIARDKKLLRKIDLHVMPLLMLTYGLQVTRVITQETLSRRLANSDPSTRIRLPCLQPWPLI